MIRSTFKIQWSNFLVSTCIAVALVLNTTDARSQDNGWRVSTQRAVGSKVYLELDLHLLEAELDALNNQASGSQNLTWSSVLSNGNSPGVDVNFSGYDAMGIGDVSATGTVAADSLVLNKDATIAGRLQVSGVTELGDSLKVSGFVEFNDSLEVVRAVAIGETLYVTGVTSLGDSLHVVGNVDIDALFHVDGAATFGSTVTVTGLTTLNDSLYVLSSADVQNNLNVNGSISAGSGSASGSRSLARGFNALASGNHAVALDSLSTAAGNSSKAFGRESTANAADAMALGFNSTAGKPSAWSTNSMGWHAAAMGANSESNGTHSYAFGSTSNIDSVATNSYAFGANSAIKGFSQFGYAMGAYSEIGGESGLGVHYVAGGMALGYASKVGDAYHAPFALALGFNSKANHTAAIAMGYSSQATAWHSLASGNSATASGPHSMAFGQYSTASFDQAIAFGRSSTASAAHALAFGEGSTASGYSSRAFGYQSVASGPAAFAIGQFSNASGYNSMGFGGYSQATAANALALGDYSEANAFNSLALGYKSITTGSQSFVHAAESEANSVYEVVLGAYSDNSDFAGADTEDWVGTDPLVVIGNGSSPSLRSNAFVMLKDGSATFNDSLHVGQNLSVSNTLTVDSMAVRTVSIAEQLIVNDTNLLSMIRLLESQIAALSGGPDLSALPVVSTSGTGVGGEGMMILSGTITSTGNTDISAAGIMHDSDPAFSNPTLAPSDANDFDGEFYTGIVPHSYGATEVFYFRAYATNEAGTAYGDVYTTSDAELYSSTAPAYHGASDPAYVLSSPAAGPCEGEATLTYHAIDYDLYELGDQCWFAQDLATMNFYTGAHLRDGMNGFMLNTASGDAEWAMGIPGFVMGSNSDARPVAAYNAAALTSGLLCPNAWHVANRDDWDLALAHPDAGTFFEAGKWGWVWDTDYAASWGIGEGNWGASTEVSEGVIGTATPGAITVTHGGASTRCVKD